MNIKMLMCLLLCTIGFVSAQDKLTFYSFTGKTYEGSTRISNEQVRKYMALNDVAFDQYETGRSIYVSGGLIGKIGAFMLGWNTGTAIAGGEPKMGLWVAGSICFVSGVTLNSVGASKIRKGIEIYNSSLESASFIPQSIEYAGNGLFVTWNF